MSHEVETMAFAGETPWHGLGNPITNDLTPEQMMEAAGCNWDVMINNNCYPADHQFYASQPIENSNFIERVTDGAILGHYVAGDYKPVQNSELFNFFAEFVDNGSMYLHTAGSLYGGQKVWCMASTKEGFTLDGDDEIVNNLLFTISHTGKHANSALNTPVRVVCANTMRMAMDRSDDIIRHNHRAVFDAEALKVALGVSSKNFGELEELAKAMAKRVLSGDEEINYFREIFGGKEREDSNGKIIHSEGVRKAMAYFRGQEFNPNATKNKETKDAQIKRQQEIIDAIMSGTSVDEINMEPELVSQPSAEINMGWDKPSAKGTLWGAFNTVTYMSDHKPVRDFGQDSRLDKAFYGNGLSDIKTKAMDRAKELLAV